MELPRILLEFTTHVALQLAGGRVPVSKDLSRKIDDELKSHPYNPENFEGEYSQWREAMELARVDQVIERARDELFKLGVDPDTVAPLEVDESRIPLVIPRHKAKKGGSSISIPDMNSLPSISDVLQGSFGKLKLPALQLPNVFTLLTKKFRTRLSKLLGAGTGLVGMAGIALGGMTTNMSSKVEDQSKKKLAVAYIAGGENAGYLYGGKLRTQGAYRGSDRSTPIPAEAFKEGGLMHYYEQGLIVEEDQGHETGFSSYTGFSPRLAKLAMQYAISKLLNKKGDDVSGGSSLADQTCGAMQDGLPWLFDSVDDPRTYNGRLRRSEKMKIKLDDTLCGIGLALRLSSEEISALHATYVYLAPNGYGVNSYLRAYHGSKNDNEEWVPMTGYDDPRVTIGLQFILAAEHNRTWTSTDERWEQIVKRAKRMAKRVYEKSGESPFIGNQGKEFTLEEIYTQIDASRPLTIDEVRKMDLFDQAPKYGHDYMIDRAFHEATQMFGEDMRDDVASIHTAVNSDVLGAHVRAMRDELNKIASKPRADTHAWGMILNNNGEIISGFSGKSDGNKGIEYDYIDRPFEDDRSKSSLGKFLLAVAVAKKGYTIDSNDPKVRNFIKNLRISHKDIIQDAKDLGVTQEEVMELISLFGEVRPMEKNRRTGKEVPRDYIQDAALGIFDTTQARYIGLLHIALTGRPLPIPHVVTKYTLRDGGEVVAPIEYYPDAEKQVSAVWVPPQSSGHQPEVWRWFSVPLQEGGTLAHLSSVAEVGKTGTGGQESEAEGGAKTFSTNAIVGRSNSDFVAEGSTSSVGALLGIQSFALERWYAQDGTMIDMKPSENGRAFSGGNQSGTVIKKAFAKIPE